MIRQKKQAFLFSMSFSLSESRLAALPCFLCFWVAPDFPTTHFVCKFFVQKLRMGATSAEHATSHKEVVVRSTVESFPPLDPARLNLQSNLLF
jgi:hypothetical protein